MKRGRKAIIWALGGVLLSTGANAVTPDASSSPYSGIVARNVFNLHDPPKPPDPESLIKKDPLPKLTLTGITTILGKKVTFLTIPPAKPGAPAESFMLAEGQAQSEIQVTQIDEKAGVVKVINHGEPETLDFDHNGAKPPPGGPGATPMLTIPRPGMPAPNILPAQPNVTRPLRPFGQPRNIPTSSQNGSAMNNGLNFGNRGNI